jgi:CubicO group peptidase (beta-lactamase class C family)
VSFEEYLRANIWRPLGMTRTAITLTPELRARLAPGYEFSDGRYVEQPYERYHTTPASSINATATDMGRFPLAHLGDGALGSARILSANAARAMRQTHARGHPDVPGVGYGFFEDTHASVRIVEHLGAVAGVSSALVLFPDQRSGFFLVNHGESSTLRDSVKLAIVRRLVTRPNAAPPALTLSAAEAAAFIGTYGWNV